jgi:hypothetical protein
VRWLRAFVDLYMQISSTNGQIPSVIRVV